jgi:hypothetical protein
MCLGMAGPFQKHFAGEFLGAPGIPEDACNHATHAFVLSVKDGFEVEPRTVRQPGLAERHPHGGFASCVHRGYKTIAERDCRNVIAASEVICLHHPELRAQARAKTCFIS